MTTYNTLNLPKSRIIENEQLSTNKDPLNNIAISLNNIANALNRIIDLYITSNQHKNTK